MINPETLLRQALDALELKKLFSYDPNTGIFTRRVSAGATKAGDIAGSKDSRGYLKIKIDYRNYQAHRLAWLYTTGVWPEDQIDHINGAPDDNRIENLREATNSANQQNRRKARGDNKLGVLGVRRSGKRFQAEIRIDGKASHLGTYPTAQAAHAAYLTAKREMHPGGTI